MRQSSKAILGLLGGVLAYEALCEPNEMISERVDEWLEKPIVRELTAFVIGSTALHLLNIVPNEVDWIHQLGRFKPEQGLVGGSSQPQPYPHALREEQYYHED